MRGRYIEKRDENGMLATYDLSTGEKVSLVDTGNKLHGNFNPNLPATVIQNRLSLYSKKLYSERWADLIIEALFNGETLSSICRNPRFPERSAINRWRNENPEFDKRIKAAQKHRAELAEDMIYESAMSEEDLNACTPVEMAARKLQFDKLKWVAKVNDPDRYGDKKVIEGNTDRPLQLIIDTGIVKK